MHTIKYDSVLGRLKFVAKNEDSQVYGKTIPDDMVSREIKESKAYKTYFAFPTGKAIPKKARKGSKVTSQPKKASSIIASDESDLEPAKKLTGRRKPASGSSEGVGSKLEVPDEPKGKSVDTSEGAGSKPEVPDVSKAMSSDKESVNESWGDSRDDDDHKSDDKRAKTDNDKSISLSKIDEEEESQEDEFVHTLDDYVPMDDETCDEEYIRINKEMYDDDVNVEMKDVELADEGKGDEEMTGAAQVNVENTQEKVDAEHEEINQEVESAQVQDEVQATTTAAFATQKEKNDVPPSSSSRSVSSNYSNIFLNLDNLSSIDTEIISMLDVHVQQEIPNTQSSTLLTVPVLVILEPTVIKPIPEFVTVAPATTIPPVIPLFFPIPQQSTPIPPPTTTKATTFTTAFPKSETLFAIHLRVSYLKRKSKSSEMLITLQNFLQQLEFEHKQALFDAMTESKSFNKHPKHITLYHALIESILADEEAMDQGVADLDKQKNRKPADDDRDEEPPAGLDQRLKRRKTNKDVEPSKRPKSNGSSKGTTRSQPKSTSKSVQAEETFFEAADTDMPQNQGDNMGNIDEQPNVKAVPMHDWFKKPKRPLTPDPEWNKGKLISNLTKADLVGPVYNLLKGTCKSCVELEYNMEECYKDLTDQLDWNNLEGNQCPYDLSKPLPLEIEVRRSNQKLYKFKEGDFPRLHMNDIEDMRLLVVQNRLFNLNGDVIIDLADIMYVYKTYCHSKKSRRPLTGCKKLLEEAQPLMATDLNRKRLMRTDKLYKFSDDTLKSVRDTLLDIANNFKI
ncbi:hypothetical protein Tco_0504628 [Tanacetum coccineum]